MSLAELTYIWDLFNIILINKFYIKIENTASTLIKNAIKLETIRFYLEL